MIDRIIVIISFAALIAFCGLVIVYVAVPDLAIITALILALAAHDFWTSLLKPQPQPEMESASLESRPTGVSGKPATREEVEAVNKADGKSRKK